MQRISITNPQNIIDGTAKKYYFKLRNTGGPKGDKGDKGDTGATGPQGPQGNAATVSVGSTTTLPVGYDATVTNSGSVYNAVLNFGIPQGPQGPQGAKGDKGDTGAKGDTGPRGPQGERGTNATVYVGTTSTLAPGSRATVYNSGSDSNAVLNFGIPQGAKGDTGATGATGPTGPAGQNFAPTIVTELPETGDSSKLYLTPKAHTTQNATGNPVTATVAEQAGKIESFQLDGDTFQQSYTGKNLFDRGNMDIRNGYLYNNELVYTTNYNDRTFIVPCEPNTTYTVSRSVLTSSFRVAFSDTAPSDIPATTGDVQKINCAGQTDNNRGYSITITTGANAKSLLCHYGHASNDSTTINQSLDTMMVEAGLTASDYEPYVGGQPSPSPDYPQPIQTVTGEQTVSIIGKNLFNKNAVTNGGYINTNGEVVPWETFGYSEYIRVIGGQTYSYSGTANNVGYSAKAAWYDSNKNFISAFSFGTSGQVTAPATAKFLRTSVRIASPSGLDTYQLELGSTITTYEAYRATNYPLDLGDIELCKIGDYRDYIYTDNGKWYIHKEIDSYTFKGDTTVDLYEYNTDGSNNLGVNLKPRKVDLAAFRKTSVAASVIYSDKFGWSTGVNYEGLYITGASQVEGGYNGNVRLYIAHSRLDDYDASLSNTSKVALVTDWLANNNLTVYYVRNRSAVSDEEITDDGIIAQLEAIRNAQLATGTNTITNSTPAPNLAGDMEIGYYGYNPTNRYDKWIWLDFDNSYEQLNNPEPTATLSTRSLSTTTEQTTPTKSVETVSLKKGGAEPIKDKTELPTILGDKTEESVKEEYTEPVVEESETKEDSEIVEEPEEENSEQVESEKEEIKEEKTDSDEPVEERKEEGR